MTVTTSRRSLTEMSRAERRQAVLQRMSENSGAGRAPQRGISAGRPKTSKASRSRTPKTTNVSPLARLKPQWPTMLRWRTAERLGQVPTIYYYIMATVAVFVMIGLVMVFSATSVLQVAEGNSPYAIFFRQMMWAGLGFIMMVVVLQVSYQRWRSLSVPFFFLTFAAMILPFIPGIGAQINGASSWVHVGSISFQPSEFLKLASLAFLANWFARFEDQVHIPRYGVFPLGIVTGLCAGASFAQGDLGSAIVLAVIALTVGLLAGVPIPHLSALSGSGMFLTLVAVLTDPRRLNRLTAFMDTEANKDSIAWQSYQSLLSIANGGLTGSGIGGSKSKLGYLPLAHSDFIFAVIADELGFLGAVGVIGGFFVLLVCGMQTALAAPDRFGMLLAGGIAVWFAVQALIHTGGVVGIMPVTGLTLPFFSHGGSSLLISLVAAGFMLNIARRAVTDPKPARTGKRRWLVR